MSLRPEEDTTIADESLSPFLTSTVTIKPDMLMNVVTCPALVRADHLAAVVWSGAYELVEYLGLHVDAERLRDRRVVEVGAGVGAVGLAVGHLGAAAVTLTDVPEALPLLRRNVEAQTFAQEPGPVVEVKAVEWGNSAQIEAVGGPFDVVLCSECVYEDCDVVALLSTLSQLVAPHGELFIAFHDARAGAALGKWWDHVDEYFEYHVVDPNTYAEKEHSEWLCLMEAWPIASPEHPA